MKKNTQAKAVKTPPKSGEIHSLKQMQEKILEKFEERQPDIEPEQPAHEEPSSQIADAIKVISKAEKKDTADIDDSKEKVEAVLFAVGKYLEDEAIAQLCEMDKRHVKKALEQLKSDYDMRSSSLMIVQEGSRWKINVREKYLSLVRKIVSDTELSKSIMETLAVIAWKTPIYQNEVVRIRGNKCYDHIEELVNAGFVTKDKKGRSYVLKTTEKFYNYFDIDQKNLSGVMNEAKMPDVSSQTTLTEQKPEENTYSREKLLQTLETIQTKSIVQTQEDKDAQREFLSQIHSKIDQAAKRTDEVISELPMQNHEEQVAAEEVPPAADSNVVVEKDEEIVINTDTGSDPGHHFQKPEDQPSKPKQLTKKQLEKKFKEELMRVKEKAK